MKKLLLLLLAFSGFNYVVNAQCKTCKQGAQVSNIPAQTPYYYKNNSNVAPPGSSTKMYPQILNGNDMLGESYYLQNVCGLNYTTASVEINTRATWQPGTGFPANITVNGCDNITVLKAFAYWEASYTEVSPPATTITLTNPALVTGTFPGTLIGTDVAKCWGETGTAVYRADVTTLATTVGNYTINSINGFANAEYEVDGATLIIIYKSASAFYSGSILLYDGCYTHGVGGGPPSETQTLTGFNVCAASSGAAFGVFGDMQNNISPPNNTETFNGSTATFPNLFWNYDSIPTTFTSGQSSSVFDTYTNNISDCYCWLVAGLYWQNTVCMVCVPNSLSLAPTKVNPTCGNNNGSISVGVTGGSLPYTYSWSPNVSTTASATGLSVGVYVIKVTDASGCYAGIDTVTLVNLTGPVLTVSTVNIPCFNSGTGSATVTATGGTPGYTYSWSPGGATTSSITGLSAGSYTVTVTDANGCQSATVAYVTQPPPFNVQLDSLLSVKCYGDNNGAIYVDGSGGTPAYNYSWSNGPTSSSITGLSVGSYQVTITDANGCITDTTLSITQPAALALSVSSADESCNLSDGLVNATVTGGTLPYTYSWSNGYTGADNTGLTAGLYCVTVTDANGCTGSVCATITDSVPFTVSLSSTSPTCFGGNNGNATATVTGSGSPWTYLWTPTNQNNSNATNLTAGMYTVTVTDNSGCAISDVITLTQPPQMTCSVVPPNDSICMGQSLTLTATAGGGTPPYTYTWDNSVTGNPYTVSPVTTQVYTVVASDANGCTSAPGTATVTVRPAITVSISPSSAYTCEGTPVTFKATATGGNGVYSYVWSPGGQTTDTITVAPSTTTIYSVTVTDTCSTPAATDNVKLSINPTPVVNFSAFPASGCSPLCVQFTDNSTIGAGGTIQSWQWNFGDTSTVADTLASPYYCYNIPGQYSPKLTVTSDSGCSASYTANNIINVYGNPVAKFSLEPQPVTILTPTIHFTDLSTDSYGGLSSWLWTFGDALDSIVTTPDAVHTYSDTGSYCATLTVTNIHGCMDSTTECLVISAQYTLYIPDAFTPNGNGIDDVFLPVGEALNSYDMYIFNRWGQLLFYTNNITKGWDGTVNHQLCQEDTYVYVIDVVDNFNKKHTYIGRVTLIK